MLADVSYDELQVLLRKKAKTFAKFSILMYIYFYDLYDAVEEATCK